jgi:hypothetical protein
MVSDLISDEEERRPLERVMASRTFSRSDQLRSFLRYICDAELEGRAHELNEYVLGVSVLGRPASYPQPRTPVSAAVHMSCATS